MEVRTTWRVVMRVQFIISVIIGTITAVVIATHTYLFSQYSPTVQMGSFLLILILILGFSWLYSRILFHVIVQKIKSLQLFEIIVILLSNLMLWALVVSQVNINIPSAYFTRSLQFQIPENAGENHLVENICIAEIKINGNRIANELLEQTQGDWQETAQGYICGLHPGSILTYTVADTSEKIIAEILFPTGPTSDEILVKTDFQYDSIDLFENQPGAKLLFIEFPLKTYWHAFLFLLDSIFLGFLIQIVGFLLIHPLIKSILSTWPCYKHCRQNPIFEISIGHFWNYTKRVTSEKVVKKSISELTKATKNWFQVEVARDKIGIILFLSSLLMAIIILLLAGTVYAGDSLSYFSAAKSLMESEGYSGFRTLGYPSLMIVSGLFLFESFLPLLFFQTLMAAFMPYIGYKTLKSIYPPAALLGGIVFICSLVPFIFEKYVLGETATMFLTLLAIYFSALFLQSGKSFNLYFAIFTSVFVGWVRPDTSLWWIVFILVFWVSHPKKYLHYVISILLIIMIVAFGKINFTDKSRSSEISIGGISLFSSVYLTAGTLSAPGDVILSPNNGPGTVKMIETVSNYLNTEGNLQRILNTYNDWAGGPNNDYFLGQYTNDSDGFINSITSDPVFLYCHVFWDILRNSLGSQQSNNLFIQVSIETIRDRPLVLIIDMTRDLQGFFFGPYLYPTTIINRSERFSKSYTPNTFMTESINDQYLSSEKMQNSLRWGIKSDRIIDAAVKFEKWWTNIFPFFRTLVAALLFIGLVLVKKIKQVNSFYLLGLLIVFYKASLTGLFSSVIFRYVAATLLVEIMLASISAMLIFNGVKQSLGKSYMN
jgi:hypothetical protein